MSAQVLDSWKNLPLFFSLLSVILVFFLKTAHSGKLAPGELPGFCHLHDSPLLRGEEMKMLDNEQGIFLENTS